MKQENTAVGNTAEMQAAALQNELGRLCSRLALKCVLRSYESKKLQPGWDSLGFEAKLVSLLQEEEIRRNINAVRRMRSESNLPAEFNSARFGELVQNSARKMDENVLAVIKAGDWMVRSEPADLVISGPCGVGKTFIAACCANYLMDRRKSVYFIRSARLFQDLTLHRLANNVERRKAELGKFSLLVLDDFLLESMADEQCSDLLDVINDRARRHSTVFTTQFTMEGWIERLGDSPLSQAVVDRLAHSAYRLHIDGPSMRKVVS